MPPYHFVIILTSGPDSYNIDGLITPAPGATRQSLYRQIMQNAVEAARDAGLRGGHTVAFFSLEPDRLTA